MEFSELHRCPLTDNGFICLYPRSDAYIHGEETHLPWRFWLLEMIICRQKGQAVCDCRSGDYRIRQLQSVLLSRLHDKMGKGHYHSSLSRRCSFTASPFHSSLPTRSEKSYFGFSSSTMGNITILNVYLPNLLGTSSEILFRRGLTILSNVGIEISFFLQVESIVRWLRMSCCWRTPVRAAVLCRFLSRGGRVEDAAPYQTVTRDA